MGLIVVRTVLNLTQPAPTFFWIVSVTCREATLLGLATPHALRLFPSLIHWRLVEKDLDVACVSLPPVFDQELPVKRVEGTTGGD